jgi:adenylylsulfate kinase
MNSSSNIHPVSDQIPTRADKERMLRQHSMVIWFSGLSSAGKTTLARELEVILFQKGYLTQSLDGDNIRRGINNNLGFSDDDRKENIRRIAEVSKLLVFSGVISLNSFISPTKEIRQLAKDIIGRENFIEVFVDAPLEVCERRDVKGLYKMARAGQIKNFTGIDALYESPRTPDITINTDELNIADSLRKLLEVVLPKITYSI